MKKRILTALVAGLITLILILPGKIPTWLFTLTAMGFALFEFFGSMRSGGKKPLWIPSVVFSFTVVLQYFSGYRDMFDIRLKVLPGVNWFALLAFLAGLTAMICFVFGRKRFTFESVSESLLGTVYIVPPLTAFLFIRNDGNGLWFILLLMLGVFSSDCFAYLIGSRFGKHKLCPEISPHKTVEGSVAGMAGSVIVCLVFGIVMRVCGMELGLPLWAYPVAGLLYSVIGQLGDLFASRIKRACGIKDFGTIMPGHGGILDRLDSLIPSFVFTYLILQWI